MFAFIWWQIVQNYFSMQSAKKLCGDWIREVIGWSLKELSKLFFEHRLERWKGRRRERERWMCILITALRRYKLLEKGIWRILDDVSSVHYILCKSWDKRGTFSSIINDNRLTNTIRAGFLPLSHNDVNLMDTDVNMSRCLCCSRRQLTNTLKLVYTKQIAVAIKIMYQITREKA